MTELIQKKVKVIGGIFKDYEAILTNIQTENIKGQIEIFGRITEVDLNWQDLDLSSEEQIKFHTFMQQKEEEKVNQISPVLQKISPGFALKIAPLQERLQEVYGFAFPDAFFLFWQFHSQLPEKSLDGLGFGSALNIYLGEVFDIFKNNVDIENFNPLNGFRHYNDPPEFFTLLIGDTDGLHWGYYLDDPDNNLDFQVASYYANDAFEISLVGYSLFEVIRYELERAFDNYAYYRDNPSNAEEKEFYEKRLGKLELIRDLLKKYCTAERPEIGNDYTQKYRVKRNFTAPTRDRLGIIVEPEQYKPLTERDLFTDSESWNYHPSPETVEKLAKRAMELLQQGFAGTTLKLGKDLWTYPLYYQTCHQLLSEAYTALNRPTLLKMLAFREAKESAEIVEFQEALQNPELVKDLNLRDKNLSKLSPRIKELVNLEILHLSFNNLADLPDEIGELKNLQKLYLGLNVLLDFPKPITNLLNLSYLNLNDNYLHLIPEEISALQNLKFLYLDNNKLSDFPKNICQLAQLEVLSLKGSSIHTLHPDMENLQNLREFYWQTDRKPKFISGNFKNLEKLNKLEFDFTESISNQYEEEIIFPIEFCYLENLQELTIKTNKILRLPEEIQNLKNLAVLQIDNYQLTEIPEWVYQIKSLKRLSISCAKIQSISPDIKNLEALEDVYLYGNQISTIPLELIELPNLQKINLLSNELSDRQKTWLRDSLNKVAVQV